MDRRAKIVATLGPSSSDLKTLAKLIKAGANVFRLNMSHGTHEGHLQTIKNIRNVSKSEGVEIGILCDLQGPKIRVDKLPKPLVLENKDHWWIGTAKALSDAKEAKGIPTVYEKLADDAKVGDKVLFDDGLIQAEVIEKAKGIVKIEVSVGGELKSNKGINLPYVKVSAPSFTPKDKEDLLFGLRHGVDFIALSFVRSREDVYQVKSLLHSLKTNIPIISKIEKPEAIDNLDEILDVTDMIMVARGDMGVEVGNHLVPALQKKIIKACNAIGTPVITATQMLESMISNPSPTRAEASDVANAIWDGTDAVMLSGETASGDYPVEAVTIMGKIVEQAEKMPKERPLLRHVELPGVNDSTMVAASLIAEKIEAKWVFSVTQSGNSCRKVARFRPKTPVLGITNTKETMRRLTLFWGVLPYLYDSTADDGAIEFSVIAQLQKHLGLENGDRIVITRGDGKFFQRNSANSIRVETVKDPHRARGTKSQIQEVKVAQGTLGLDLDICASCRNCISICPHDIWKASDTNKHQTVIDEKKASLCSLDRECVKACPTGAIEIIDHS